MPVPTPQAFREMLQSAKEGHYAYPAINVTSMETANAAMKAFVDNKSDGIIQLSLGAGKYASGPAQDSVLGAISVAEHVHRVAAKLPVYVALHTDHCQLGDIRFIERLLDATKERRERNGNNLFNGHMFDGSALPLEENLKIARKLLEQCIELEVIPEFEAGVVGGEEEGAAATDDHSKMYTTPEDMVRVYEVLSKVGGSQNFLFAATFGNVHGIYKPGNVKLRPEILRDGQLAIAERFGKDKTFYLVFHGGSGTPTEQIQETLEYGVVKMNVDTAAQYAFTRKIADHMFTNYSGVLMIDGEMGNKKLFDPRSYLKAAVDSMADRVAQATRELRSAGRTICKGV
jgi:fructose-bisphosphate aldolase, class II